MAGRAAGQDQLEAIVCFDSLMGECRGWVRFSSGGKEIPAQLAVEVNNQAVTRIAQMSRPDVASLGFGSGEGGFRFAMPQELVTSSELCMVHLYDVKTGLSLYRGEPAARIGELIRTKPIPSDQLESWDKTFSRKTGDGSDAGAGQPPAFWEPLRLMPVYVGEHRIVIGSLITPPGSTPRLVGKDCRLALTRIGLIPDRGEAWQISGLWHAGGKPPRDWHVQIGGWDLMPLQICASIDAGGAAVLAAEGNELLVRNWSPTSLMPGVVSPMISTVRVSHKELPVVSYCLVDFDQGVHWTPARVRVDAIDLYAESGEATIGIDTQSVRAINLLESLIDGVTGLWERRGIEAAVSEAYWLVLGRGPDPEGLEVNVDSTLSASVDLGKRQAIAALADAMRSSDEYRSKSLDVLCEPITNKVPG